MFIEVHIKGQLYHRWKIDDYENCTIEGATWQQNIEARERLVKMFLDHFIRFTGPLIPNNMDAEFFIVFESKLNSYAQSEMPGNAPDELHNAETFNNESEGYGRTPESRRDQGNDLLPGQHV